MRVGANARQFARIKKLHAAGTPAPIIAKTIQMTDQSLERILAGLDDREVKILAIDENPEVQKMRIENAELLARLAKYENPDNGEEKDDEAQTTDGPGDETQEEPEAQEGSSILDAESD